MEIQSYCMLGNTNGNTVWLYDEKHNLFWEPLLRTKLSLRGSWETLDWELWPAQGKDLKMLTPGVHEEADHHSRHAGFPASTALLTLFFLPGKTWLPISTCQNCTLSTRAISKLPFPWNALLIPQLKDHFLSLCSCNRSYLSTALITVCQLAVTQGAINP